MKITKRQLKRIIREESHAFGGGAGEYKRDAGARAGDVGGHYKDYEGPSGGNIGDESKTDPGHEDYEGDVHHKAKTALAAIHDLAGAAGVEITPSEEEEAAAGGVEELALEGRYRRGSITRRQLRRIIREEKHKLREDSISDELEHLRKNKEDDLEHIDKLEKDIEEDREETHRAEEARKDESLKRHLRRIVRENTSRAPKSKTQPEIK